MNLVFPDRLCFRISCTHDYRLVEVTKTSAASNVPLCVSGKQNNANELLRRLI